MTIDQVRMAIFDAIGMLLLLGGVASIIIGLIMIALGASPEKWKR